MQDSNGEERKEFYGRRGLKANRMDCRNCFLEFAGGGDILAISSFPFYKTRVMNHNPIYLAGRDRGMK